MTNGKKSGIGSEKLNKRLICSFFLLILYFSMLPLKDRIYGLPMLVPISLVSAIIMLIGDDDGHLHMSVSNNGCEITHLWLLTLIFVVLHNYSLKEEFLSGGVVHYIILCCFICFMKNHIREHWADLMYKIMLMFFLIHAVATITFVIMPASVYVTFVKAAYPYTYMSPLNQFNQGRIPGICSHYSTNGIYLSLGVGVSFVYMIAKKEKKYMVYFVALAMALLISGKRGPLVFAGLGCAVAYFSYQLGSQVKNVFKFVCIAVMGIVLFGILIQYIPSLNNTFQRFAELDNDSTGGREVLHDLAKKMFSEKPVWGYGWNSYKYQANASAIGTIYGRESEMLAHNCYLQLLAETGVVGFAVFCITFLMTIVKTYLLMRGKWANLLDGDDRSALGISIFIQIFFLAYCMTGNPLYDYACLFPYMMSCAVPVSINKKIQGRRIV